MHSSIMNIKIVKRKNNRRKDMLIAFAYQLSPEKKRNTMSTQITKLTSLILRTTLEHTILLQIHHKD